MPASGAQGDNPQEAIGAAAKRAHERPDLYLALEGGGAKGIAHIAAMAALEKALADAPGKGRKSYKLTEVAGTSIGAVVASFVAAGARADQLIDQHGRMPLADVVGIEHFYDLFGVTGWRRLALWRTILKPSAAMAELSHRLSEENQDSAREQLNKTDHAEPSAAGSPAVPSARPAPLERALVRALPKFFLGVVAIVAISLFLYLLMHNLVSASVAFITWWILSAILIGRARSFSRRQEARNRRVPAWVRNVTNPLWDVAAAFIVVTAVALHFLPFAPSPDDLLASLPGWLQIAIRSALYGTCFFLLIYSVVQYVRGVVKGAVKTEGLANDLNIALGQIITRDCRFDGATKKFVWSDKTPTCKQEKLFARIRGNRNYQITFGDLNVASERRLHVVAADTINTELCIYSTLTHWNEPVALAVAASLALPFAFRPVRTRSGLLVDGGIASSIPAWIFRGHRWRDPDARILAIGIAPTLAERWIPKYLDKRDDYFRENSGAPRWRSRLEVFLDEPMAAIFWPVRYMANVTYTALYGARALQLESGDRLDTFDLETTFHLLDFDRPPPQVIAERATLFDDASKEIDDRLWRRQERFERACKDIEQQLRTQAKGADIGRIRFTWADRDDRGEAVRVRRSYNFYDGDVSDRMVLPFHCSVAGWAAATGKCCFADKRLLDLTMNERINRYRKPLAWPEIKWCWAIPIHSTLSPHRIRAVLSIQGSCDFSLFGEPLADEAHMRIEVLAAAFATELKRNPETGEFFPVPSSGSQPLMEGMEEVWIDTITKDFLVWLERKQEEAAADSRAGG